MPEELLHILRRQLAPAVRLSVDAPRSIEVPHGVEGILGLAVLVHYSGRHQYGIEAPEHVLVVLDPPLPCREYEITLPFGTSQLPFFEGGQGAGSEPHLADARHRLRCPDGIEAIGTLADMHLAVSEVDVPPTQAPQLACSQASGDRHGEQ